MYQPFVRAFIGFANRLQRLLFASYAAGPDEKQIFLP